MFVEPHPRRSSRSGKVQTRLAFTPTGSGRPGRLFGTCHRLNPQYGSRMHLRDIPTSCAPKSLPFNLFADPHPLNPVTSIFYKNSGGRAHPGLIGPACPHPVGNPVGVTPALALTPLAATLMNHPASVANKRLTALLNPLDATLTKNTGWGYSSHFGTGRRVDVLMCRRFLLTGHGPLSFQSNAGTSLRSCRRRCK